MATTAGLTAVLVAVPGGIPGDQVAVALYLSYLAWRVLRGGASAFETHDLPRDNARRLFAMGLVTNQLNPKIALMYMALIPQFVDPYRGAVWVQVLGSVQILAALTVICGIVLGSAALAELLASEPARMRVQRWLTGGLLGFFAVKMATSEVP